MKEPKSKLPWSIDEYGEMLSKEDQILSGWDDGSTWFQDDIDGEYCLQACNNFPKAVELLREAQITLGVASEDYNSGLLLDKADQISKFLRALDND